MNANTQPKLFTSFMDAVSESAAEAWAAKLKISQMQTVQKFCIVDSEREQFLSYLVDALKEQDEEETHYHIEHLLENITDEGLSFPVSQFKEQHWNLFVDWLQATNRVVEINLEVKPFQL